ncbi:hypothetical protein ACWGS9_21025 [Bradyrhizobium sp. Arg314]
MRNFHPRRHYYVSSRDQIVGINFASDELPVPQRDFFTLRLSAQPARRPGSPKCIYSAPLQIEDVQIDENGDVTVSIIADDIYSKNSTQRYQITLTEAEISILARNAKQRLRA